MRLVITLPDLGQTTNEAKVLSWWKRPGEKVARGEPLLVVETDKVNMDVESFAGGYLREVLVEAGTVVAARDPIAILTDTLEEAYDSPAPSPPQQTRIAAAPAAKSLARELGVDFSSISGSGPDGLIVRKDVERAAGGRRDDESRAIAAMAAIAAAGKRDIPHFYASLDVDMAAAETWRACWNSSHPGLDASLNDIFVRCAARSLRDAPRFNMRLEQGAYRQGEAGILVVIAREPGLALVEAPDAHTGWEEFLPRMRAATQKGSHAAPAMRPMLAISNLGMFGVKEFSAIIPPGCAAALAIGAVRDAAAVRDGQLQAGRVCTLTLSADHRIVDGVAAARFLQRMQYYLNDL
jgi:pyruvate dehydrogenase E2 component (dihydrolipoamide acetyltransferase)